MKAKKQGNKDLTIRENVIVLYLAYEYTCAKLFIVRPLFPCFLHHYWLQILYTIIYLLNSISIWDSFRENCPTVKML